RNPQAGGLNISSKRDASMRALHLRRRMENTDRLPSRLTFFHCKVFPNGWLGSLNRSLGVPAVNAGVVVTSTDITSKSRVIKYSSLPAPRQLTKPDAIPPFVTRTGSPGGGVSGLFPSNGRTKTSSAMGSSGFELYAM